MSGDSLNLVLQKYELNLRTPLLLEEYFRLMGQFADGSQQGSLFVGRRL